MAVPTFSPTECATTNLSTPYRAPELNRLLIDAAERDYGVEILFEHAVTSFSPETAQATMSANGETYSLPADRLIAADGAGSIVRRAYDGRTEIEPSEALLPHSYKELTIPPKAGGGFEMANDVLHVWPRGDFMLIALPNPPGDFTLTLFMPTEGENSFAALESDDDIARFFSEQFSDAANLIPNLVEAYQSNPAGILGTVRCRHWHDSDKVLLIGDAAHAVVPFHGQENEPRIRRLCGVRYAARR